MTTPIEEGLSVGGKLAVGRLIVCEKFPYFSAAVLALIHRWTPGLGTMGVTKNGLLMIDPQVVEDWTVGELATVLIHECQHLLRDHDCRCKGLAADHTLWNIACFPPGTLLPNGVLIETACDKVSQFKGNLVTLSHQAGVISSTPEHPFLVRRRKHKVGLTPVRLHDAGWTEAKDVRVDDFVCVPKLDRYALRSDTTIDLTPYIKKGEDSKGRKTFGNRAVKSIPLNEDTAWLIGLYIAEGSSSPSVRFSLGSHEGHFADRIDSIAKSIGYSSSRSINGSSMSVNLGTTLLGRWLKEKGGAKAKTKHIPHVILYHSNPSIRAAFLRGLVDGDGCLQDRAGRSWANVGIASPALARDTVLLLAQDGIGVHYSSRTLKPRQIGKTFTNYPTVLHSVTWCTDPPSVSTRVMNGHTVTTTHHRWKADKLGVWYPVKSMSLTPYSGPVYNLVNTPDHTYVAEGVLVHNCDMEQNDDILEAIEKLATNSPVGSPSRLQFPHFKHAPTEEVESAPEEVKKPKGQKGKKKIAPTTPEMGGACFPSSFGEENGKTAEEYYNALRKKAKIVTVSPGAGWCGSGAGKELPNEPTGGGRSEADINLVRQGVADALNKIPAKDRGTVPADWLRWAESQLKPVTVPWQRKLARVCRAAIAYKAGMTDYHYGKLSRRQSGMGIGPGKPILPVLRSPTPNVAVAVDTSGSMGESELLDAISETKGILQAAGSRVTFLACDSEVHSTKAISDWKQIKNLLKGGGGTDFHPIFDAIDKLPHRPDILVLATDGFGPAPATAPRGMHVIWLLIGPGAKAPVTWGESVTVAAG